MSEPTDLPPDPRPAEMWRPKKHQLILAFVIYGLWLTTLLAMWLVTDAPAIPR